MKYIGLLLLVCFNLLRALELLPIEVILTNKNEKSISIDTLKIDTNIIGNIANTTYELTFYNPNDRALEGSLHFPLSDNQHVIGHSLLVNGHYRDAVVVEKAKAKKVFEDVIRQQVDPSIVEKTLGNNFKLRLYPLPAKGFKKVKLVVEEILTSKASAFHYALSFNTEKKIKHFAVNIFSTNKAKIDFLKNTERFDSVEQGFSFHFKKEGFTFIKPLRVNIPLQGIKEDYTQKRDKKQFFMKVIAQKKDILKETLPSYENIEIIWDSSLGVYNSDRDKKIAFLETLFSKQKNCTIHLKTLGLKLTNLGAYHVKNGEWSALKKELEMVKYNGAKDLTKLRISKGVDKVLFFTNGIYTFNDVLPKLNNVPIYTITASIKSDAVGLRALAKKSGGMYFNLLKLSSKEVVKSLYHTHHVRIFSKSKNIKSLFVEPTGESLTLFGQVQGNSGHVEFEYRGQHYQADIKKGISNPYIARVWASYCVEKLLLNKKKNKEKIITLAKNYGLVTDFTSMIVLNSLEDYIRYEIVPPKELRKAYHRAVDDKKQAIKREKEEILDDVVRLVKEQKKWYSKKFPKTKKPSVKNMKKRMRFQENVGEMGGDIAPIEPDMVSPVANFSSRKRKKSKKDKVSLKSGKIKLKAWNSKATYMTKIRTVPKSKRFETYYKLQSDYLHQVAFYVDMSTFFYKNGYKSFALEVLSNILEIEYNNSEFLRVFAFNLLEQKRVKISLRFFREVTELRPFEAQSFRDLALALERIGRYEEAVLLHYKIITQRWDNRFEGSKIISLNEMNHVINRYHVSIKNIDKRLIYPLKVDMRIVINWSTDNTDMDLWVIDPYAEKTFYQHKESHIGGKISNDMTQGYGPEEFMIRDAVKGAYIIKVKYYASHQQKLTGPTVIRAEVYTNYGTKREKREEILFRVGEEKEIIDLGEVSY